MQDDAGVKITVNRLLSQVIAAYLHSEQHKDFSYTEDMVLKMASAVWAMQLS